MNRKLKPKKSRSAPAYPQATVPLEDDKWYIPKEAGAFLRTTTTVLAIWRCKHQHPELRPTRLGHKILYKGIHIRNFLENNTAAEQAA